MVRRSCAHNDFLLRFLASTQSSTQLFKLMFKTSTQSFIMNSPQCFLVISTRCFKFEVQKLNMMPHNELYTMVLVEF